MSLWSDAERFADCDAISTNRWRELVNSADRARMNFERNHGYLVNVYSETLDALDGVTKERRFVNTPQILKHRLPPTAWNCLPPIPGPAPDWYNTTTYWNASKSIGHGARRKSNFITLDYQISQAGCQSRRRGDLFRTLKWPRGAIE